MTYASATTGTHAHTDPHTHTHKTRHTHKRTRSTPHTRTRKHTHKHAKHRYWAQNRAFLCVGRIAQQTMERKQAGAFRRPLIEHPNLVHTRTHTNTRTQAHTHTHTQTNGRHTSKNQSSVTWCATLHALTGGCPEAGSNVSALSVSHPTLPLTHPRPPTNPHAQIPTHTLSFTDKKQGPGQVHTHRTDVYYTPMHAGPTCNTRTHSKTNSKQCRRPSSTTPTRNGTRGRQKSCASRAHTFSIPARLHAMDGVWRGGARGGGVAERTKNEASGVSELGAGA